MSAKLRPGRFYCTHEAGHVVATWLAGVEVVEACAVQLHSRPDWYGPRVAPHWDDRGEACWERTRVTAAGQAAFILAYPEMAEHGELIAADDRREVEFHGDWDTYVADAVEDLRPWSRTVEAVAQELFKRGTLDRELLEALREEAGL